MDIQQYVLEMFADESTSILISIIFLAVGAILSGCFKVKNHKMRRIPYFVGLAALVALSSLFAVVWLAALRIIGTGYFLALLGVQLGVMVVIGFVTGKIAMARSRDAFGTGNRAWMAFVPLVNFFLLFASSSTTGTKGGLPAVYKFLNVLLGIFLLFLSGVANTVLNQSLEAEVSVTSFEDQLVELAAAVPVPTEIDEITNLVKVRSSGRMLVYIYELSIAVDVLPDEAWTDVGKNVCNAGQFQWLLDEGGTVKFHYFDSIGKDLGGFFISRGVSCTPQYFD